jgi:hypothetical protein
MTIFAEIHAPHPRFGVPWGLRGRRRLSQWPSAGRWWSESIPSAASRAAADPALEPWPLPLRIAIHVGGAGLPWLLLARVFRCL